MIVMAGYKGVGTWNLRWAVVSWFLELQNVQSLLVPSTLQPQTWINLLMLKKMSIRDGG